MKAKITFNEYRLWVIFNQTHHLIAKCSENALSKAGSTDQQYLMLWIMQFMAEVNGGLITITDLAPILYHNVNTVSSMIDRMEKKGLVEKIRDLADRRSIRLKITPKGEEVFSNASKPSRELIKRLFSVFSDEELATLISLMKKLKTKISEELGIEDVKSNPDLNDPARIISFLNKWNAEH